MDKAFIWLRIFLDCIGVIFLIFIIYFVLYLIRRCMVERWVKKAVSAAETIFIAPKHTKENSTLKKEWVISFLKDNGLTNGIPDNVVDVLIESEVTELNLKQKEPEISFSSKDTSK